jgi:hypothetical protein
LPTIDNSTNCHSNALASSISTIRAGTEKTSASNEARKRLAPATISKPDCWGERDGLNEAVVLDALGKLIQLGFIEGAAGVRGGFVNLIDGEKLECAAILHGCSP